MNELTLLGEKIKSKRLSLNVRMDDVAKQAKITRATLWSIEKGTGNYSINTLVLIMKILGLSFEVSNEATPKKRERATRINTIQDKKINRFVVWCVDEYTRSIKGRSDRVYKTMKDKGIIDELINDYEDLHGMSFEWLNDYIGRLIKRRK